MKSRIQTLAEQQRKAAIITRANRDGLDLTDCEPKTLYAVERLYKAIDEREAKDAKMLADYEANAVGTNALAEQSGISRSTLMKQPYAAIIDAHRRQSQKEKRQEITKEVRAENETLLAWKKSHAETELKLYQTGRELEQAQQRIRELLAKLDRKDELLTEANDRLREAGLPVVDPLNPISEYTISVPVKASADKS